MQAKNYNSCVFFIYMKENRPQDTLCHRLAQKVSYAASGKKKGRKSYKYGTQCACGA